MNYDKQYIEQLLNRFLEGESTIAEEEILARYFATHTVDSNWEPYKQMFAYFESGMSTDNAPGAASTNIIKVNWRKVMGIAASVAIMLGIGVTALIYNYSKPAKQNILIDPAVPPHEVLSHNTSSEPETIKPCDPSEGDIKTIKRTPQRASSSSREAIEIEIAEKKYAEQKAEEMQWVEDAIAATYAQAEQQQLELERQIEREYEQTCLAQLPEEPVIPVP